MTRLARRNPKNSPSAETGLGERTIGAAKWRIASAFFQIIVAFPAGILLAHLLRPADFGLVALSLVIVGFISLASDLGLGAAIIQLHEPDEAHLRVALTGSVLLGISIAATVIATAPLIGRFAHTPELGAVLRLQSLVFITSGADTFARSILQRRLDFRRLYVVDVASQVVGSALVSITCALAGMGVWSLVLGNLARSAISCTLSMITANTPLRPLLARRELRQLLGFGVSVSANGAVNYIARNGDNFVVGRTLGPAALGIYSRAFNLMMMPLNYVTGAFFTTLVPVFAGLQDQQRRMGKGFLMSVQLSAIIVAPVAGVMLVAAPHLILGLYGEKWAAAVGPLQVLCLMAVPAAVMNLAGPVNRACNRVITELWFQCAFAFAIVAGSAVASRSGIVSVASMVVLATVMMYVAMAGLALSLTACTWRAFVGAQIPGALIGLFSVAIALAIRLSFEQAQCSHLSILSALVIGGGISVPLGAYALPAGIRPIELFDRLRPIALRLPAPLRAGALLVMRAPA